MLKHLCLECWQRFSEYKWLVGLPCLTETSRPILDKYTGKAVYPHANSLNKIDNDKMCLVSYLQFLNNLESNFIVLPS